MKTYKIKTLADIFNQDILQWPEFIEWIDDDRGEIGFNAYDKEGNTLKVRITKEKEND